MSLQTNHKSNQRNNGVPSEVVDAKYLADAEYTLRKKCDRCKAPIWRFRNPYGNGTWLGVNHRQHWPEQCESKET